MTSAHERRLAGGPEAAGAMPVDIALAERLFEELRRRTGTGGGW